MSEHLPFSIFSDTSNIYNALIIKYVRNSTNNNLTFVNLDEGELKNNNYIKEVISIPNMMYPFEYKMFGNPLCERKEMDSVLMCRAGVYIHKLTLNMILTNITTVKEVSLGIYNNEELLESNNYVVIANGFTSNTFSSVQTHNQMDRITVKLNIIQADNSFSSTDIVISELKWVIEKM